MAKTPEQMWHETDMKIDAKQLALAHWQYVESVLRAHQASIEIITVAQFHYMTAFEHGFKHGVESVK